jgi:hypothetical protein
MAGSHPLITRLFPRETVATVRHQWLYTRFSIGMAGVR